MEMGLMKMLFMALLGLVLAGPALAAEHKAAKGDQVSPEAQVIGGIIRDMVLTEEEKRILRDWFGQKKQAEEKRIKQKGNLPPGLAKRDSLPPGLAKQLERNGRLPPGLEKRTLPEDLKRRLPRRTADVERVVVGDDVVLIEKGTQLILDVLKDVL